MERSCLNYGNSSVLTSEVPVLQHEGELIPFKQSSFVAKYKKLRKEKKKEKGEKKRKANEPQFCFYDCLDH